MLSEEVKQIAGKISQNVKDMRKALQGNLSNPETDETVRVDAEQMVSLDLYRILLYLSSNNITDKEKQYIDELIEFMGFKSASDPRTNQFKEIYEKLGFSDHISLRSIFYTVLTQILEDDSYRRLLYFQHYVDEDEPVEYLQFCELVAIDFLEKTEITKKRKENFDELLEYFTDLDSDYKPLNHKFVLENNTFGDSKNINITPEIIDADGLDTDKLFDDLDSLIGLNTLKADVRKMINTVKVNKLRLEKGLNSVPFSNHLVFVGNPGTGKTTVARILGKMYKEIGLLSSGHLVEVDREDLVAGYVGQTAIKTKKVIDKSKGGILFIDEAYSLNKREEDFGHEAIEILLKEMEDNRDDFVVIVAGYPDLMEQFINSNPGLKSRFNKYIYFPDYNKDGLYDIFISFCKKYDYICTDECNIKIKSAISEISDQKKANFGNGREMRLLFEEIITEQAVRLFHSDEKRTIKTLKTITLEDAEKGYKNYLNMSQLFYS